MNNKIETVLGPIDIDLLGFTLMHEHLYLGNWNNRIADPEWYDEKDGMNMISPVLQDAKKNGVNTIVDVTTMNMGRDIHILEEASKSTGLNIVATTGCMCDETNWAQRTSQDAITNLIVREATEGVQGTNIKCGVIKTGTSEFGFTTVNKKILHACGKAQAITGLPLITHCRPENTRQGLFQQDIFAEEGADLTKVVIGHFRNGDPLDYALNVMDRGSYIAIDQMNFNDHQLEHNLSVIPEIIKRGIVKQLILSHDAVIVFNHSRWNEFNHRTYINYSPNSYSHIIRNIIPKLLERGVSKQDINTIFFENPKRLFIKK